MPGKKNKPVRFIAAHVILQVVVRGQSLSSVLAQQQRYSQSDSALLQEICYGTLRWFYRLDAVLSRLLERPMKERDQDIFCLIMVGLYQLEFMNTPPHAIVKETVDAVLLMNKPWAKGLVNAILRSYQRNADELTGHWQDDREAEFAHPEWLIEMLEQDWPDDYIQVLDANNRRPPMTLRINEQHTNAEQYRHELAKEGIHAHRHPFASSALVLEHAVSVQDLPGFLQGRVSVQDASAQLAAPLMGLEPGMRVLDACAAPGGKTMHILEYCPDLAEVVALDVDADRLTRVQENLDRLKQVASLVAGDASKPDAWWDGRQFDRILLDVPCSGTGVIRRHPDIKLLRTPEDIANLSERQAFILNAIWPLLAPGGMLVYSTCSVLKQENEQQVRSFIARQTDAAEQRIEAGWGSQGSCGRQVLSGADEMDGFFYACLQKKYKNDYSQLHMPV